MGADQYLEAWRKGSSSSASTASYRPLANPTFPSSSASTAAGGSKETPASYNIRLDVPGGFSLAPDQLAPHNMEKRLFLPQRDVREQQHKSDYDYLAEIRAVKEQRRRERESASREAGGSGPLDPTTSSSAFVLGISDEDADAEDAAAIQGLVRGTENLQVDPAAKRAQRGRLSAAQQYAASIDLAAVPSPEQIELNRSLNNLDNAWQGLQKDLAKNGSSSSSRWTPEDAADRASVLSAATTRSVRSTMSKMTVAQVAAMQMGSAGSKAGAHMESALFAGSRKGAIDPNIVPVRPPPGTTGNSSKASAPWEAEGRSSHRAFDRPTREEKQRGIAAFDDVSGQGRVPTVAEAEIGRDSSGASSLSSDAASLAPSTTRTARLSSTAQLRPADLFIADPRPYRPLRYVRRTDPRQVLLCSGGCAIDSAQAASLAAAKAALEAGGGVAAPPSTADIERTHKAMLSMYGGVVLRGGIGVVYCPEEDPWSEHIMSDSASLRTTATAFNSVRKEPNLSRRLERPPEFSETNQRRAALRAACAALEYTSWEEEGFDKIVLACAERWIVEGISSWIWSWRANGWKLSGDSPLGIGGEQVPDRDLWELLDHLVKSYEKIE